MSESTDDKPHQVDAANQPDEAGWQLAQVYPDDALTSMPGMEVIAPQQAVSLPGLFRCRVERSGPRTAYRQYDAAEKDWVGYSWERVAQQTDCWSDALAVENLAAGERVAVRMSNRLEWILCDQAVLAGGLVVVPVYCDDRPDNVAYIIEQTESRLLMVESLEQWQQMPAAHALDSLQRVVVVDAADAAATLACCAAGDERLVPLSHWLRRGEAASAARQPVALAPEALATIVYTSGTTGRPKGVMLSHRNILETAYAGLRSVAVFPSDRFLSFLPLSHMFERTAGYYLTMMAGACVAFNRSIPELPEDMAAIRPTVMITVPRIFERAHARIKAQAEAGSAVRRWLFERAVEIGWRRFEIRQRRAVWSIDQIFWPLLNALVADKVKRRFGGALRFVISGGAPLGRNIARLFIGLDIEIVQGYGLTETSPVLSVNTLDKNQPDSIGLPLAGTRIRLGKQGELQASSPSIMLGYWRNPEATAAMFTPDGWLKTGDIATLDAQGFIRITGRIKDIIVMATGEKVPPADIEAAVCNDPLFEQVMVLGEGRPFLSAVVVLNPDAWPARARALGVEPDDDTALQGASVQTPILEKIAAQLKDFPGYAAIYKVHLTTRPWTVDDGTLTPTLKIKRPVLHQRFAAAIERMYQAH